ncbi:hypothetical protein GWK47_054643 [Chionoecetes opilio]|uniref:Uncharacterized protein n=1 Tax=Chionoecetes opilio TaxID=41210 RepID=A0A8J4XYS8_CHIOP|nr:hypothetical protein GWK47_054643 [Chionoecetes opilio]
MLGWNTAAHSQYVGGGLQQPQPGEWIKFPDMPHCVSHAAVCGFEGRVLVFTQEMQLLIFCPTLKKWSVTPLKSSNTLGYRAALPFNHYVYLIDNCSPQVYRFRPREGTTVTTYGLFTAPPINVCVVDGTLYNFSHDDLCDGRVVETMELEGGDVNSEEETNSEGEEGHSHLSPPCSVHSKEMWRGNDPGKHMFTTLCPAESTFSLGTFPLLKVRV